MTTVSCLALSAALATGALCAPAPAVAAADYDHCEFFIDSLPATIDTTGTWCLRGNLAMAPYVEIAVDIVADDVLLDCKQFKIGGLAAGVDVVNTGIRGLDRSGLTIRNCQVRGFYSAIHLTGDGSLVEDNLVEDARYTGIHATGSGHLVRNNRVLRTGSNHTNSAAYGIHASGDVIGNTVDGLRSRSPDVASLIGIYAAGNGATAQGNVVRGFVPATTMVANGVYLNGNAVVAKGNHVMADFAIAHSAIRNGAGPGTISYCRGNTALNFLASAYCTWGVDNLPAN